MKLSFHLLLMIMVLSCGEKKDVATESKVNKKEDGIRKVYYPDGKLKQELSFKNEKLNGVSREYYLTGKIFQEISYSDNIKHGEAKWYYETGVLFQLSNFAMGKRQGVQKKYRPDGSLASESIYFNNHPCVGLKEYTLEGKLKVKYPTIVIEPINAIQKEDRYSLQISMSDNSKIVDFFTGTLDKDGCISEKLDNILKTSNGMGVIDFDVPPGSSLRQRMTIIANVKTLQENFYVTQRSYQFSVNH